MIGQKMLMIQEQQGVPQFGSWAWGDNSNGQLGLGDTGKRSSPVQIGSLTIWDKVDCGTHCTIITKTDDTLWTFGYNNNGQLGLGDITKRSSPVQVGSLTSWDKVATGEGHIVATKTI